MPNHIIIDIDLMNPRVRLFTFEGSNMERLSPSVDLNDRAQPISGLVEIPSLNTVTFGLGSVRVLLHESISYAEADDAVIDLLCRQLGWNRGETVVLMTK